MLGNALKGRRDQVIIASKTLVGASTNKKALMAELEGNLRRLQTDHIDIYFNHAVNHNSRLDNPEWHEFCSRAQKQGKIRFTGMSGHAGRLKAGKYAYTTCGIPWWPSGWVGVLD